MSSSAHSRGKRLTLLQWPSSSATISELFGTLHVFDDLEMERLPVQLSVGQETGYERLEDTIEYASAHLIFVEN